MRSTVAGLIKSHILTEEQREELGVDAYTLKEKGRAMGVFLIWAGAALTGGGMAMGAAKKMTKAIKKGKKKGGPRPQEHQDIVDERRERRAERRNACGREKAGQNPQGSKKDKGQKGPSGQRPSERRKDKQKSNERERNVGIDEEHSRRTKNNPGSGAR